MKATLKLILCSIMLLGFILPATAMEDDNSSNTLTPSSLFTFKYVLSPKNNIGQVLKNAGFTQTSVKENKKGYIKYGMYDGLNHDTYYSTFVQTFTKGSTSIKYRYAIDKSGHVVDFEYVDLSFPSKSEMDTFTQALKSYVKKQGLIAVLSQQDKNLYVFGAEDEDYEDLHKGVLWPYSSGYEIKGNTLSVWFTCGCMNPHEGFERE